MGLASAVGAVFLPPSRAYISLHLVCEALIGRLGCVGGYQRVADPGVFMTHRDQAEVSDCTESVHHV